MVSFSGNGYQLFFKIPEIEITEKNAEEIEEKIQTFEKLLIAKYSNEKVRIDNVGDLPRIMRIPGTWNLKSKSFSQLILKECEEDALLKEYILDLKPLERIVVGGLSDDLKEKIRLDDTIQSLMRGELGGKPSRSEAELSLVCRLVQLGLDKEQIFQVMGNCRIGKWQEAHIEYRNLTYRKAIELISEERLRMPGKPTLSDLYLIYKKWLYLEDTKRIDIVLATYMTNQLEGTPIWLMLVGNSGDGKTEQSL